MRIIFHGTSYRDSHPEREKKMELVIQTYNEKSRNINIYGLVSFSLRYPRDVLHGSSYIALAFTSAGISLQKILVYTAATKAN